MRLVAREDNTAILVGERKLNVIVFRDDDQYTAFCPELDLATAQNSPEEAIEDIILAIKEYAQDYMENFESYSKSVNRRKHRTLVQRIANLKDDWQLREMIEVRYGNLYIRPVQEGS